MYRNGLEGKLPALSSERTSMLEELGICWGERRKTIPWDERFQALLDYKVRYGFFFDKTRGKHAWTNYYMRYEKSK